jgi:hypothetical protein
VTDVASQRLLTMMDPWGHRVRPGLAPRIVNPTAVVWMRSTRRTREIADQLGELGLAVLRATSFRHVDASLRPDATPACALAVIDFAAIAAAHIDTLTSARWMGYLGAIIAVAAPGEVTPHTRAMLRIEDVVAPAGGALRAAVERWLAVTAPRGARGS